MRYTIYCKHSIDDALIGSIGGSCGMFEYVQYTGLQAEDIPPEQITLRETVRAQSVCVEDKAILDATVEATVEAT